MGRAEKRKTTAPSVSPSKKKQQKCSDRDESDEAVRNSQASLSWMIWRLCFEMQLKKPRETVIGGMYCAMATPAQTYLICCRVFTCSDFKVSCFFVHAANFKSHVLFEDENSARKLETTVLKNRKEPSLHGIFRQ